MNGTTREQQRLLIVDDSKVVRVTARKILRDHFETVEALDGENAWDILSGDDVFSLVISDLSMPKLDGFELLARIRNSHLPHIRDLPVIIITGANDSEATKKRATQAGATDFIGKPFDSVHLLARSQAHASAHSSARTLKEESIALEDDSAIDPLTRLANEFAFMERGYQQLAYAIRHNTRLSVFHIEVDRFGELYKTHGDSVAESIIQTVATVLTTTIRHEDTAARIGTARFALLLPGLNSNGIQNLANRIRKNISERVLKHGDKRTHFTISIGVAATEIRRNTRFDDLISIAGNRLRYAIDHGGDRIVHEGDDSPATSRQPAVEMTVIKQAESRGETRMQADAGSIQVEEITADLPTIECRITAIPASSPDKDMAAGTTDSKRASPAPVQHTSAPLNVPDLSLLTDIPGFITGITPPVVHTDDATIKIAATTGPTNATGGQPANKNTGEACRRHSSRQTVAARKARTGLLRRFLTGVFSLFRRT